MLKSADAYFPFFPVYSVFFFCALSAENVSLPIAIGGEVLLHSKKIFITRIEEENNSAIFACKQGGVEQASTGGQAGKQGGSGRQERGVGQAKGVR